MDVHVAFFVVKTPINLFRWDVTEPKDLERIRTETAGWALRARSDEVSNRLLTYKSERQMSQVADTEEFEL